MSALGGVAVKKVPQPAHSQSELQGTLNLERGGVGSHLAHFLTVAPPATSKLLLLLLLLLLLPVYSLYSLRSIQGTSMLVLATDLA